MILAIPVLATAQVGSVDLSAPALGYVYDGNSKSLRAIEGVPGAAAIGEPMLLGVEMEWLVVSPNRRYALGHAPGAERLTAVRLDGGLGMAQETELAVSRPWYSPGGRTVALLSGEGLEVWTGFPDTPRRLHTLPVSGAPDIDSWTRVDVSDDGGIALVRTAASLWRIDAEGAELLLGDGFRDALLLRDSHDVVVWEDGHGLLIYRKAKADAREEWLRPEESEATGFALSADERRVLLTTPRGLVLVDRDSNRVIGRWEDAPGRAASARAEGNAVFVIAGESSEEVLILDGDAEVPQLMAVGRRVSE
jgi:hypothetical protein